jgi:two-component system nitrate/nitrite response regulator NarL
MREARARATVLVADDHPVYREGIAQAVREREDLELVAECADAATALARIAADEPDLALVDLQLGDVSGLEVVREVEARESATRVVLLSAHVESAVVYDAVAAGAAGYLSKDADRDAICDALVAAARGENVFSPGLGGALFEQIRARGADGPAPLSPRETEVLRLVANGATARDVAERLYLGETTVKTHLKRLYQKLGVSDRASAVAEAMRRGILR